MTVKTVAAAATESIHSGIGPANAMGRDSLTPHLVGAADAAMRDSLHQTVRRECRALF